MTSWLDESEAVDVVYLDFITVAHNILIDELWKCEIDECTEMCTENWVTGRAQRVVIHSAEFGWTG